MHVYQQLQLVGNKYILTETGKFTMGVKFSVYLEDERCM